MKTWKGVFDFALFLGVMCCILWVDNFNLGITLYALVYAVVAGVFLESILKPSITRRKKALAVLLYFSLLSLQLFILIRNDFSPSSRTVAASLLLVTFLTEQLILRRLSKASVVAFENEQVLSFEDLRSFRQRMNQKMGHLRQLGGALSPSAVREMLVDLPRHRVTRYVNKEALSEEYLAHLEESMEDPYVYLVFSDTGSVVSTALGVFHKKLYNHISIAFDSELATLISYNGGEKVSPPGLNPEIIQWFYKKEDASIRIYRLKVSRKQKEGMAARIRQIDREGSAYNLLGFTRNKAFAPNIMFCSQFVYCLLEEVGANYFQMAPEDTKPSDLIEQDYLRKLEYMETIMLSEVLAGEGNVQSAEEESGEVFAGK